MVSDLFTRRECFCVGKLRREKSYEIKTSQAERQIGTATRADDWLLQGKDDERPGIHHVCGGNVHLLRGRA